MQQLRTLVRNRFVAGTAVAALSLAVAGCQNDTAGPEEGAAVEDVQEEEGVAAGQEEEDAAVFGDVESFVGEQVTVSAQVTEVLSNSAFRLTGDDVGGEPLLVLSATGATDVEEGVVAQVTGTVRVIEQGVFEEAGFETDDEFFTGFGVENEEGFFTEFGGEHAIFADSVEVLEGGDAGTTEEPTEGTS